MCERCCKRRGLLKGALDAIQTGNQINGQVAAQLMKMNSQMATTNQAQLNWIAQQSQLIAQAQKNSRDGIAGYGRSRHRCGQPHL